MGLLQPKGPNPHETDVNSPRYTEASKASKRATEMGISGDAATLIGRGFERVFIQSNMELEIEAGDFAYIGNRVGLVTNVTLTRPGRNIETITVVEDLGALPLDWRQDPAGFGYDDNGPGSTTKTTTYAIDPSVAAEVINGGGALLSTGTILICRKRTADRSTWTKEAQDQYLYNRSKLPKPTSIEITPQTSPDKSHDQTQQFSASILPTEASQDVVWSIDSNGEDVSINQNGLVTIGIPAEGTYVVTAKSQVDGSILATANLVVVL